MPFAETGTPASLQEENDCAFIPLRKKTKFHETNSNHVNSVYEKCFAGDKMSDIDIENLRWHNGIEVKGIFKYKHKVLYRIVTRIAWLNVFKMMLTKLNS